MTTIKLFDKTEIPATISTTERIFQIETYNRETVLCNLLTAKLLINTANCKRIKHYWDYKFTAISKLEVKEMPQRITEGIVNYHKTVATRKT